MATITYRGLSGTRTQLTVNGTDSLTTITNAAIADEGLAADYYADFFLLRDNSILLSTNGADTYDGLSLTASDELVAVLDDDPTTFTKQQRQVRKLEIASIQRSDDGYANSVYDITSLPNTYNGNVLGADDNPNTGGLLPKRPWISVGAIAAPESIGESIDGSTLTSLQIWYDGADTKTYVPSATDEGQITQWTDKSNFAHNANPDGGNAKPTYENTVLQNGYGYLEFDGGDSLKVNPFTQLASQAGFTVFIVAKQLNTTGVQVLTATDQADLGIIGGSAITVAMAGATATTGPTAGDTNWHQHTLIYDGTGGTNADKLKYRLDKTGKTLSFTGTVAATTDASNSEFFIGNDVGGTNGLTGYVGEVILFNKTLKATEYANVENYLSNKWGL